MGNEVHLAVVFIRIELEIYNQDVVNECEDDETHFISHELCHSEHVPFVFSAKACKGSSRQTFAAHIIVDLKLEFDHVEELEDGEEEAGQHQSIVCNA